MPGLLGHKRMRRLSFWLVPLAVMLVAAGCFGGGTTYPVDNFPEMHFQAGARFQEPPRMMPAQGSVPTRGSNAPVDTAQLGAMSNPQPRNDANLQAGRNLFMTNCSMCHGQGGKGDGTVATNFRNANATTLPADLTASATQTKTDGQLWGIITNGGLNMPAFGKLLTDDDRWRLVLYLKTLR